MRRFDSATMRMVDDNKPARRSEVARYVAEIPSEPDDDLAEVVAGLTVAEVIELVEAGEADLADVIDAERVGKARKTVLSLVQGESGKVYPDFKTDRDQPDTDSNEKVRN